MAWEKLTKKKECGGLGFRDIKCFNITLLDKQLWGFITHLNLLVSKVLKAKYYHKKYLFEVKILGNASWFWKSVTSAKNILENGLMYRIRGEKSIDIWNNKDFY